MVDLDELQALAAKGMSMARAAAELGVTRARVHQIAKKRGIAFVNGRTSENRMPPARGVDTGGPSVLVTPSASGKVLELLVAADLTVRGWQVFMPLFRNRGHDLCAYAAGNLISIEVRIAHRSPTGGLSFQKRDRDVSMYYALAARGEVIRYVPELPSGWTKMPDEENAYDERVKTLLTD